MTAGKHERDGRLRQRFHQCPHELWVAHRQSRDTVHVHEGVQPSAGPAGSPHLHPHFDWRRPFARVHDQQTPAQVTGYRVGEREFARAVRPAQQHVRARVLRFDPQKVLARRQPESRDV